MIRKYQNELIVLASLIVFLGGFLYQKGMTRQLDASLTQSREAAQQITETKTLQKVWSSKGLKQKVAAIRQLIPAGKIKTFDQKKTKVTLHFSDMTGKELNTVTSRIAALPVQIQEIGMTRSGDHYDMRCTCSW